MCMFQTEGELAIVPLSYKRGNEIKLTSLWVSSCDIQLHAKPLYNPEVEVRYGGTAE